MGPRGKKLAEGGILREPLEQPQGALVVVGLQGLRGGILQRVFGVPDEELKRPLAVRGRIATQLAERSQSVLPA